MTAVDVSPFRDLYPWDGDRLEVSPGVRLHFLDEGSGEALLALHGNPTWSFTYRRLVARFSDRYRVVVPDHVGCGLSDKPDDGAYPYVLERRVEDVSRLVEHLGLRDLTLVLHDWGGMIGLAWAMRNLDRVKRLVLFNTSGFGLPPGKRLPWEIGVIRHLPWFPLPVRGLNAFLLGALRKCTTVGLSPKERHAYLAPYRSWADRIAIQRFVEDIPLAPGDRSHGIVADVSENLDRLSRIPTLVCWGAKDFVFDDHFLAEWRRRLPQAEYHRFEEAGHWVHEDAHERILPLIESFLERHPLPCGGTG